MKKAYAPLLGVALGLLIVAVPLLAFGNEGSGAETVFTVSPWVDVATRFGLPGAILVGVLYYHVRVVREKDAEIKLINAEVTRVSKEKQDEHLRALKEKDLEMSRINELRVTEAKNTNEKSIEQFTKFMELTSEVETTLRLILDSLKR
jgi:hypothetical protein